PARLLFSLGTERSGLANLARRLRKVDQVIRLSFRVAIIVPNRRGHALGAVSHALFPIDRKLLARVGALYFSLPRGIYGGGTDQVDAVMNPAANQVFRRHIASAH